MAGLSIQTAAGRTEQEQAGFNSHLLRALGCSAWEEGVGERPTCTSRGTGPRGEAQVPSHQREGAEAESEQDRGAVAGRQRSDRPAAGRTAGRPVNVVTVEEAWPWVVPILFHLIPKQPFKVDPIMALIF